MTKEQVKSELKKMPFIRIVGKLQVLFILAVIASPFIGIWYDWFLALKIGLSGVIGTLILYWIDLCIDKAIDQLIENDYKEGKPTIGKSKFHQKLEELAKNN